MHKLERTTPAPDCLAQHDSTTQTWDNLAAECKANVRAALTQMQGPPASVTAKTGESRVRCAYCEGALYPGDGHIEHFRRKSPQHFPQLTFTWSNLFLSCNGPEHCGHYKDRRTAPTYDPARLIKPDEDDPEFFLYFHSSGEVRPRTGLNAADTQRAKDTIAVFGLNAPALKGHRRRELDSYRTHILSELDEIETWLPEERNEYLRNEIEHTRWAPYATTFKHFLQKR